MDDKIFSAILAMDSYNRGYNQGIFLGEFDENGQPIEGSDIENVSIGLADISFDSSLMQDVNGQRLDIPASFYAIAYNVEGAGTIIAYRGTDQLGLDTLHGYGVASGVPDVNQGVLAFGFYQLVANGADPRLAPISVTGHSLGGGLAGLVGAVYGKEGALFDNMPFELAANATYNELTSTSFQNLVYGTWNGGDSWEPTISSSSDSLLQAHHLDGEFLDWLRPFQQTPDTPYSLPGDPNLSVYVPDNLDLHSLSALIIHMFSFTEIGGATAWEAASPYFWPLMFNNDFATSIGMDAVPGRLSAADNLSTIIAYSAIEHEVDGQGNVISQSVFGDTGIRALYDDANDLGAALALAGEGSAIETYATEISQAFVQFAGQLALSKTLLRDIDFSIYKNGVLWGNGYPTLDVNDDWASGDRSLTVSFFEPLWSEATTEDVGIANMTARDELINTVITDTGIETNLRQYMLDWWGSDSPANFDKVVFATDNAKPVSLGRFSAKGGVFVGDADAEVVSGAAQDDLLLGFGGNNDFYTSYGEDIFIGGVNNDTVIATPRNDEGLGFIFDGGSGFDVVDYSATAGIDVIPDGDNYRVYYSRYDPEDPEAYSYDLLINVEKIIGGSQTDYFEFGSSPIIFEGGDGKDRYKISAGIDDVGDSFRTPNVIIDDYYGTNTGNVIIGADAYDLDVQFEIDAYESGLLNGQDPEDFFSSTVGKRNSSGGITITSSDHDWPVLDFRDYWSILFIQGTNSLRTYNERPENFLEYLDYKDGVTIDWDRGRDFTTAATPEALSGQTDVFDTADYSASGESLGVNLMTGVGIGGFANNDTYASIEGVIGSQYGDIITGNDLANDFFGLGGDDTLIGGAGNDILAGGLGNDTYVFNPGDDFDVINETGGTADTLLIGGGLTAADISFVALDNDLFINIASGVTITNQLAGISSNIIEYIRFDDGTVIDVPVFLDQDNYSPVAAEDEFFTDLDTSITLNVLGNDWDVDQDELTVTAVTQGVHGSVVINPDNTLTYIPNASFIGTDSFSYDISDGNGEQDTATVTINVTPIGTGTNDDDILLGGNNSDVLKGLDGDDELFGGLGNDRLDGGLGNDLLDGGDDSDVIYTGLGNDTVTSGSSADIIVVLGGAGSVTITDFNVAEDVLDFVDQRVFDFSNLIITQNANSDAQVITSTGQTITLLDVAAAELSISNFNLAVELPEVDSGLPPLPTNELIGTSGQDFVEATDPNGTAVYGGEDNDELYSSFEGGDYLFGEDGDDLLFSQNDVGLGPVVLDGGAGFDELNGGFGDDFFIFNANDAGLDILREQNGHDVIIISEDLSTDDLSFSLGDFGGLTIWNTNFAYAWEGVELPDQYGTGFEGDPTVEQIVVQGLVYNLNEVVENGFAAASGEPFGGGGGEVSLPPFPTSEIRGTSANDFLNETDATANAIYGEEGNDIIHSSIHGGDYLIGGDGNDHLYANSESDDVVLEGGLGGDTLNGSIVDDFYIFNADDEAFNASDIINEAGGIDTLVFSNEFTTAGLSLFQSGSNLIIDSDDNNVAWDSLSISNYFSGDPNSIVENIIVGSLLYDLDSVFQNGFVDGTPVDGGDVDPNEVPIAKNDTIVGVEGQAVTGNVLDDNGHGVDYDPNGVEISVLPVDQVLGFGHLVISSDGSFTLTPNTGFTNEGAPVSFTYTLVDPEGNTAQTNIIFEILPFNEAPGLEVVDASVVENSSVVITASNLRITDLDSTIDDLVYTITALPQNGTLQIDGVTAQAGDTFTARDMISSTVVYTPSTGFFGPDTFDFVLTDGRNTLPEDTLTINVIELNDIPVANDDVFDVAFEAALSGNVLDNDTDENEDDTLSVVETTVTSAQGVDVTLTASGEFTYTAPAGFSGADNFTYTIDDGNGGQDTATVTINVYPEGTTAGTNSDDTLTGTASADILIGLDGDDVLDGGLDDDIVTGGLGDDIMTGGEGNDTFVFNDLSEINANSDAITDFAEGDKIDFTDIPGLVFIGQDAFSNTAGEMRLEIGGGQTWIEIDSTGDGLRDHRIILSNGEFTNLAPNPQNGNILQLVPNRAPVANADTVATDENMPVVIDVLANDTDADLDILDVTAVTQGANGSVVLNPDGTLTYTPNANFNGTDSFSYDITDGNGGTATATVDVTVSAVNDAPVLTNNGASMAEDTGTTVTAAMLEALDIDNAPGELVFTLTSAPAQGSLLLGGAALVAGNQFTQEDIDQGLVTYAPEANANGTDSFNFTLGDGDIVLAEDSFDLLITPVNDAPEAQDDSFVTDAGSILTGNLLADNGHGEDADIDGDTLIIVPDSFTTNQGQQVTLLENGSFTYVTDEAFAGADSFTYTLSDGQGGTDTATVNITVNATQQPHIVGSDSNDFLFGTSADELIMALGGWDLVVSGSGNDVVYGGEGRDTVLGGPGDDILYGEDGDDILLGNWDNDILNGGAGSDLLTGGSGDDIFVFDAETAFTGVDTIIGFDSGDAIDISDILQGFDPLSDAITDFVKISNGGFLQTEIAIDADGGGDNFVKIAEVISLSGLGYEDLITHESLPVA